MDPHAQHLLQHLCQEYDSLSELHQTSPFPEFSATINHEHGHCLVHCPLGSQRLSIVSVNFAPYVRGQGVLKRFIRYIQSHPYQYRGVEVATIQNQSLAKRLLNLGWQHKSLFNKMFRRQAPTLICDFDQMT